MAKKPKPKVKTFKIILERAFSILTHEELLNISAHLIRKTPIADVFVRRRHLMRYLDKKGSPECRFGICPAVMACDNRLANAIGNDYGAASSANVPAAWGHVYSDFCAVEPDFQKALTFTPPNTIRRLLKEACRYDGIRMKN